MCALVEMLRRLNPQRD